jgi:hypothetical protein
MKYTTPKLRAEERVVWECELGGEFSPDGPEGCYMGMRD